MMIHRVLSLTVLGLALSVCCAGGPQRVALGDNAALRYWSAFSAMQDSAITDQQAKTMVRDLNAIIDGTTPYDDSQYRELIEQNKLALEIMARATALPTCDWGLDYSLGGEEPVEYARKALALGRLNVLYAFHLMATGDKNGAASALAAGLRFSQDVANGGTLFANLVAENLMLAYLRTGVLAARTAGLSPSQRSTLQEAVASLGNEGLDWQSAARRELDVVRTHFTQDPQASEALTRIASAYVDVLSGSSGSSVVRDAVASAPRRVAKLMPSPQRVLDQKQVLTEEIAQARAALQ